MFVPSLNAAHEIFISVRLKTDESEEMDPYFFKVRKSEEIDGGSLYLRLIDYCLLVAREQHFFDMPVCFESLLLSASNLSHASGTPLRHIIVKHSLIKLDKYLDLIISPMKQLIALRSEGRYNDSMVGFQLYE